MSLGGRRSSRIETESLSSYIAARFFDRSADTKTFKRGMDAYNNPDFYRQLGKNPEQLMAAALKLLAKKFSL